jgi:hypothetical protein
MNVELLINVTRVFQGFTTFVFLSHTPAQTSNQVKGLDEQIRRNRQAFFKQAVLNLKR